MSDPHEPPVLEAATVIRVPPPGMTPDYVVAAVREGGRLHAARLDADPDDLPPPGCALQQDSRDGDVPVYRA